MEVLIRNALCLLEWLVFLSPKEWGSRGRWMIWSRDWRRREEKNTRTGFRYVNF